MQITAMPSYIHTFDLS